MTFDRIVYHDACVKYYADNSIMKMVELDVDGNVWEVEAAGLERYEIPSEYLGDIQVIYEQMLADAPANRIRKLRKPLLQETDWAASSDVTMSPEMAAYRQALRDLPATATDAAIDEHGILTGVTWPTKPE